MTSKAASDAATEIQDSAGRVGIEAQKVAAAAQADIVVRSYFFLISLF